MRRASWLIVALILPAAAAAQLLSPDHLAKPHAQLEGLSQCTKCHELGQQLDERKCLECHQALAARLKAGSGYHARLTGRRCIDCHPDHRGVDFPLIRWQRDRFDHDSTGYALEGGHRRLRCDQCHRGTSYLGLSADCAACHQDPHRGQFSGGCATCHTPAAWKPAAVDHARTRFPLRGGHANVACAACHVQGKYRGLSFAQCRDCHTDRHQGQFTEDCAACHELTGWRPARYDHDRAAFQLLGAHRQVACGRCHLQGRYRPVAHDSCSDCHRDPHRPSLGSNCGGCHAVGGWRETRSTFDHSRTRFPLQGRHATVACDRCHAQGRYRGLAYDACRDCHADRHQGQFTGDCATCHRVDGWKPLAPSFDHGQTRFPLRGRHPAVDCSRCHVAGRYRGTSLACRDCHSDRHGGQFAADCSACHDEQAWAAVRFDHATARFVLDGAHVALRCEQCHPVEATADGVALRRYRPLGRECVACHG